MSDGGSHRNHSGDRLGATEPVEALDVNRVSIHEFGIQAGYLVFTDGDSWYGLRSATQEVEFASDDGVEVINAALAKLGEMGDGGSANGSVHVISGEDSMSTKLVSDQPIEHTADGTTLILERGTDFEYTGSDQAIIIGGENMGLEFDIVRANEAPHVVRDLGLSNSRVHGHVLFGGSHSVWFCDAENQVHTPQFGSRTEVLLTWMWPQDDIQHGIEIPSVEGAPYVGYKFITPVMFGTNGAGVVLGDRSDADTVNHNVFYGDVDPSQGPGTSLLVDVNDSHNAVYLKDYIRTSGGSFDNRGTDVRLGEGADDSFIIPQTFSRPRVKREALRATDMTRVDRFQSAQTRVFDIFPDTLAGYGVTEEGSAAVQLHSGAVEQSTGSEAGSIAGLRKRHDADYGRLSFDNKTILQTNVQVSDNSSQQARLLWGDVDGPAVGWRIVDDRLEGYVHDGNEATTLTLRQGFEPGASWNLTAMSLPAPASQPDKVLFYVENTYDVSSAAPNDASLTEADLRDHDFGLSGVHLRPVKGVEAEVTVDAIGASAGHSAPDGLGNARKVMTVEIENTDAEEKSLAWSTWRHHHRFPFFNR